MLIIFWVSYDISTSTIEPPDFPAWLRRGDRAADDGGHGTTAGHRRKRLDSTASRFIRFHLAMGYALPRCLEIPNLDKSDW